MKKFPRIADVAAGTLMSGLRNIPVLANIIDGVECAARNERNREHDDRTKVIAGDLEHVKLQLRELLNRLAAIGVADTDTTTLAA